MMQGIALKVLNLMSKAFSGQTAEQNRQNSWERYACARLVKAHQLCAKHSIEIPLDGIFYYTPELLADPAVQNYLYQLGFADGVHGMVSQTNEPHYTLGYEEGKQYGQIS